MPRGKRTSDETRAKVIELKLGNLDLSSHDPIAAIISLYLCYKIASHLVKSLGNENIIKH